MRNWSLGRSREDAKGDTGPAAGLLKKLVPQGLGGLGGGGRVLKVILRGCGLTRKTTGKQICSLFDVLGYDVLIWQNTKENLENLLNNQKKRIEKNLDIKDFLTSPKPSKELASIAKRLLQEASRLYKRSESGLFGLPTSCQPGIYAARYIYEGIGAHIESVQYDSINQRAITSKSEKITLLAFSFLKTLSSKILPVSAVVHAPALREVKFLVNSAQKKSIGDDKVLFSGKRLMDVLMELEKNDKKSIYLST